MVVCFAVTVQFESFSMFLHVHGDLLCATFMYFITPGQEGSLALQLMVTNHDIYGTGYIYPPSLAGKQTRDPHRILDVIKLML